MAISPCGSVGVVGTIVVIAHLTADHEGLQLVLVDIAGVDGGDEVTVAQDGDAVGHAQDLSHVVADEDHAVTLGAHVTHDLEELVAAVDFKISMILRSSKL